MVKAIGPLGWPDEPCRASCRVRNDGVLGCRGIFRLGVKTVEGP